MEKRYSELDSLRGIAAFTVLLGHFMLLIPGNNVTNFIEFSPLRIFVASSEAVTLFFVLSGFVLSLPFYKKNNKISYFPYLFKRFLRIYLPYYASLLLVIICSSIFYSGEINQLSLWFNQSWNGNSNVMLLLQHLFLLNNFPNVHFNPVLWSLVHEMRISIIFPLLMLLIVRKNWIFNILFGIGLTTLGFTLYLLFEKPGHDFFHTLHYTSIFIIGALLAKHRIYLVEKIKKFPFNMNIFLGLIGLFFYLFAKPAFALSIIFGGRDPFLATILDSWFVSIGASLIILLSLSSKRFSVFLSLKLMKFLGEISYSLYLYHHLFS